jgi:GT2 family glycosyltransferase
LNSKNNDDLISIIIINYNGLDYILDCVESIFQITDCNYEVILIDNNSSDNSSDICKEKFSQIRLFHNEQNLSMAARNIGIDNAKGKYILFLDVDTILLPNSISALFQSYLQHGTGLYQGKILEKENKNIIASCGNLINIFGFGYSRGNGKLDENQFSEFTPISFPVGACIFSSLDTIKKIGNFDESGLLYLTLDDLDYGWRSWLLGIPSFYEPKSTVYHMGRTVSKLNSKTFFYIERNRWILLLSLYSRSTFLKLLPSLILIDIGISLFLIYKKHGFVKLKAFFYIIKQYSRINKRHKTIMMTRQVPDKEILRHFVDDFDILDSLTANSQISSLKYIIRSLSKISRKLIC